MRARLVGVVALSGLAGICGPACAQDSFSLEVTLPPLGAAQAAQDAGAVGSWTVLTPAGGLMIAGSGESGLTIYSADANRFRLMTQDGTIVPPLARKETSGLTAQSFGGAEVGGQSRLVVSAL
jgi:hypothetical protein